MGRETLKANVWKGRSIRILAAVPSEQTGRVHEAIACQAYRLFESHGLTAGHEAEDWRQAESQIVQPLDCGLITQNDKVSVCTDIAAFGEGNVEVRVEPRRLSLCGRSCPLEKGRTTPQPDTSYRLLDLPVEVDPSHVHARFNGRILEIDLYRTPLLARAA